MVFCCGYTICLLVGTRCRKAWNALPHHHLRWVRLPQHEHTRAAIYRGVDHADHATWYLDGLDVLDDRFCHARHRDRAHRRGRVPAPAQWSDDVGLQTNASDTPVTKVSRLFCSQSENSTSRARMHMIIAQ